jgi:hypothetical protein
MARPPIHQVRLTVPKHIIDRAKRAAKAQDLDLNEFLRRCIEGRLNQIEATKEFWGSGK